MKNPPPDVDWTRLADVAQMHVPASRRHEVDSLLGMLRAYLHRLGMWSSVKRIYVGHMEQQHLGVFVVHALPVDEAFPEYFWAIIGDCPPAILPATPRNAIQALSAYAAAMQEWVDAVRNGSSLDRLMPIEAAATAENADLLAGRIRYIDEEILKPNEYLLD